jgi:lipooligosaccharide transport system permease protein
MNPDAVLSFFPVHLSLWGAYSVWYRLLRGYTKTWLVNCLPSLTEPLLYFLAFGFGLGPVIGSLNYHGSEIPYLDFLAPGMIGIAIVSQAYFEGAYGIYIRIRYERSWQALLAGPLTFEDIFFGEIAWAATKGMIGCTATAFVAHLFGVYPLSTFLSSLPVFLCASILFASLGALTAGVVKTIDQINVPMFLLIIPMMLICGSYFPREGLPQPLKLLTDILPLSAVNDLSRIHLVSDTWLVPDILLLIIWTLGTATAAFRSNRRRVLV